MGQLFVLVTRYAYARGDVQPLAKVQLVVQWMTSIHLWLPVQVFPLTLNQYLVMVDKQTKRLINNKNMFCLGQKTERKNLLECQYQARVRVAAYKHLKSLLWGSWLLKSIAIKPFRPNESLYPMNVWFCQGGMKLTFYLG